MTALANDRSWLGARAERTPDATALIDEDRAWTWRELADQAARLSAGLRSMGVSSGQRTAVIHRSDAALVALLHAIQDIGAVLVPMPLAAGDEEINRLLRTAQVELLVTEEDSHEGRFAGNATVATVDALESRGTGVPSDDRVTPYDGSAAHSILFTSGTTNRPKGVVLTNANHYASATATCDRLGVTAEDLWIAAMPMNHVGGLSILLRSVIVGFPVLLRSRFAAEDFDSAVRHHRATIASMVPTMLARWLDHIAALEPPAQFRCALIGGAGIGSALLERAQQSGVPVATTYGLTETASGVCTSSIGNVHVASSGVVPSGTALEGTEVEILAPDNQGVGEIVVRGPQVMAGYYADSAATDRCMVNGRLHTGDRGRLADDGTLEVMGRGDEVIISGGENISPAEVEETLSSHPEVVDAGVYGIDDEEWGQAVQAKVVRKSGSDLDEPTLRQWCRDRLAGYKVPKKILFIAILPRTGSGKLRRTELADLS